MRPETERRDPATIGLDLLAVDELVRVLTAAHADVSEVVAAAAPATAVAVTGAVVRLEAGGRLVYAGSGTPGWLLDADSAELPPTFGFPHERLAVVRARPAARSGARPDEDSPERGAAAVAALGIGEPDVVVAVASSGATPFTVGAAERAMRDGAFVVAVTSAPHSPLAAAARVRVLLRTGAEPIMGSTRMRAGLAQRLWLTVFSSAVMVRLGLTHDNLMVNVAPALAKLRDRRVAILAEATGDDRAASVRALRAGGDDLRIALVMALAGMLRDEAERALETAGGRTRVAITASGS